MERRLPGERWPAVLVILGLASAACVALVVLRVFSTRQPDFAFLVWNLVLAWVPFVLAIAVYGGYRHGAHGGYLLALSVLWLLFLPNAPYIVTDFVHLQYATGVPRWFDALAVGAYAATGLLLGFASLYLMQAVAARTIGVRLTWWWVVAVLCLSSVGIYLGRYQRLNSWDVVRQPRRIIDMVQERLQAPFANETLLVVTLLFSLSLTAAYVLLYTVVLPRMDFRRGRFRDEF
ncbi:MAG: DUF1361 domain-containing protein [Dehalococcoidia bacterium]